MSIKEFQPDNAVELDLGNEFLNHRSQTQNSESFLVDWKKFEDGIVVWLHKKTKPVSFWTHNWFIRDVSSGDAADSDSDGENPLASVKGRSYTSLENETVNERQYHRDRASNRRKAPVRVDPFAFFIDWVSDQLFNNKLDICDPVLRFGPEGDQDSVILYAGGITGYFGNQKLDKKEREIIYKKTGVAPSEAWKQKLMATNRYITTVIPHEEEHGTAAVLHRVSGGLGGKIKSCIEKWRHGERDENPDIEYGDAPFAMQWIYNEDALPQDRYDVKPRPKLKCPEHVLKAFEEAPPNFRMAMPAYNMRKFRKELEAAALLPKMPIARFFEAYEEASGNDTSRDDGWFEAPAQSEDDDSEEKEESTPSVNTKASKATKEPEPEEIDDACMHCGKSMGDELEVCKHCGAKYEVNELDDGVELIPVSRPCGNPDCMEKEVPIDSGICPQCKTSHDEDWKPSIPTPADTTGSKRVRINKK